MDSYGSGMSGAGKIVVSAAIGGTAEALGGVKPARRRICRGGFANGAVTGAFVYLLNHASQHGGGQGGEKPTYLHNKTFSKSLALMLKYTRFIGGNPNPFFNADAIYVDGGVGFVGAEYDKGWFFVLSGDEGGQIFPFTEHGGGGSTDASAGIEFGRVDLVDKSVAFTSDMLFGERTKGFAGAVFIGGSVSYSVYYGNLLISTSLNVGFSISPFGVSVGANKGLIKRRP